MLLNMKWFMLLFYSALKWLSILSSCFFIRKYFLIREMFIYICADLIGLPV